MPKAMIGTRSYPTLKARREAVQAVLGRYDIREVVSGEEDVLLLHDLIAMHPKAAEKIGPGVAHFRVIRAAKGSAKGPEAVHINGDRVAFSYKDCLEPPTHPQRVVDAMRTEIEPQATAYLETRKAAGTLVSDESGTPLATTDVNVVYFRGPRFHDLATQFVDGAGGWDAVHLNSDNDRGLALFTDRELAARWHTYHRENAVLALLSKAENRRRPHR